MAKERFKNKLNANHLSRFVDARREIHQSGVCVGLLVEMVEPLRVPPYMTTLFLKRH